MDVASQRLEGQFAFGVDQLNAEHNSGGAVRDGLSLVRLILMKAGGSTMGRPFQRLRACSFSQSAFSLMAPKSLCSGDGAEMTRSEEHTSELQSLMRISYAVFCLKKK